MNVNNSLQTVNQAPQKEMGCCESLRVTIVALGVLLLIAAVYFYMQEGSFGESSTISLASSFIAFAVAKCCCCCLEEKEDSQPTHSVRQSASQARPRIVPNNNQQYRTYKPVIPQRPAEPSQRDIFQYKGAQDCFARGDLRGALREIEQTPVGAPSIKANLLANIVDAYRHKGELENAEAATAKIDDLFFQTRNICWAHIARDHLQNENPVKALATIEKVAAIGESRTLKNGLLTDVVCFYLKREELDQAGALLKTIFFAQDLTTPLCLELADRYMKLDDSAKAAKVLSHMRSDTDRGAFSIKWARNYIEKKTPEKALSLLFWIPKESSEKEEIYQALVLSCFVNQKEEALLNLLDRQWGNALDQQLELVCPEKKKQANWNNFKARRAELVRKCYEKTVKYYLQQGNPKEALVALQWNAQDSESVKEFLRFAV